jgi:hypothetical protein
MESDSRKKIDECKNVYRAINKAIRLNNDVYLVNLIKEYVASDDFHILRMTLVAIKPIRDEELIAPLHQEILDKIQNKLGKILY